MLIGNLGSYILENEVKDIERKLEELKKEVKEVNKIGTLKYANLMKQSSSYHEKPIDTTIGLLEQALKDAREYKELFKEYKENLEQRRSHLLKTNEYNGIIISVDTYFKGNHQQAKQLVASVFTTSEGAFVLDNKMTYDVIHERAIERPYSHHKAFVKDVKVYMIRYGVSPENIVLQPSVDMEMMGKLTFE